MNGRVTALFPCLALFALFAACEAPQQRGRNLSADIFEDLPAPREAVYRHNRAESFSWRGASFRCGRFQYDYSGAHADAVRFYQDTMTRPPYSWELVSEQKEREGSAKLQFRKGDDVCTVDVDFVERHVSLGDTVTILVRVNCLR